MTQKKSSLHLILKHLGTQPVGIWKIIWIAVILMLVAAIGALHYFSGRELNFFILFLIPTIIAAWALNFRAGILIALVSVFIGFISDFIHQSDAAITIQVINAVTRFAVFSLVVWGVWKIHALSHALADLALTDTLTGLNNRRAFMLRGTEEMERARRYDQPLSVMFIDLDNFKSVNDLFGHDEGDELLKLVADITRGRLRTTDYGARMGGDEFAAILPATDSNGSRELGENLRIDLNAAIQARNYPATASIGIATFLHPPATFALALVEADALMYEVKKSTKNAVLQREFSS